MGAGQIAVVRFQTDVIRSTITRPADTTQYAAGEVLSDATDDAHCTFDRALLPNAYSGSISNGLIIASANNGGGLADLELWLFYADIAARADNATFVPTDAEMATLLGVIEFPVANWRVGNAGSGAAGNAVNEVRGIGMALKGGESDIFGQLVVRNTYTPISGETFTVALAISRD